MGLREFFNVLYSDFDKSPNLLDIMVFSREKIPLTKYRKFCGSIDEVINHIKYICGLGKFHIYFRAPLLKPGSTDGTADNVDYYTFLFADIDAHEEGDSKEEKLEKIKNFKLKPSIIVDTGYGYHVYFLLDKPLKDKEVAHKLLEAICIGLGSDGRALLSTQLLRVPDTFNVKDISNLKKVTIVEFNKTRYSLDEIENALQEELRRAPAEISSLVQKQVEEQAKKASKKEIKSKLCFDFSTPPTPLNITVDNFPELLILLKKQNIFLASNQPHHPLGKTFNCIFHPDEHPSANIFISKKGYYYYKCFGCNILYDIIQIYKELKGKSFIDAVFDLAKFFGIQVTQNYNEWVVKQWEKYYHNAMFIENFEALGYREMYPNLYKLLKPRFRYLSLINHHGLGKIGPLAFQYEGQNLIFFSYEFFASKYKVDSKVLFRNINLFATLGFIKKVPIEKVPPQIAQKAVKLAQMSYMKEKRPHETVNFYIINRFLDVLPEAEKIAKKLIENSFSIQKCMNKIFLIKTFGQEFADVVYPDERTVTKKSESIANALERTLLRLIKEQGYATKEQIIAKTNLPGRLKATREDKERELQRNFATLLKKHNLAYIKVNKALKEKFNLKSYINIIIPATPEK